MDCRTAEEGMVSRYIKHDLPLNELEEFLDHVYRIVLPVMMNWRHILLYMR